MNTKNQKNAKKKIDKKTLALRIACFVLAALMVFGAAYTCIAFLIG